MSLEFPGTDLHAPAELLGIAAACLKTREPMPDALADYLAHAFAHVANAPEPEDGRRIEEEHRARLLFALGMTRNEGRPRAHTPDDEIAATVAIFGDRLSETAMKTALAEVTGVSPSTARTRIKDAKANPPDLNRIRSIMKGNGLNSFVRPRDPSAD